MDEPYYYMKAIIIAFDIDDIVVDKAVVIVNRNGENVDDNDFHNLIIVLFGQMAWNYNKIVRR